MEAIMSCDDPSTDTSREREDALAQLQTVLSLLDAVHRIFIPTASARCARTGSRYGTNHKTQIFGLGDFIRNQDLSTARLLQNVDTLWERARQLLTGLRLTDHLRPRTRFVELNEAILSLVVPEASLSSAPRLFDCLAELRFTDPLTAPIVDEILLHLCKWMWSEQEQEQRLVWRPGWYLRRLGLSNVQEARHIVQLNGRLVQFLVDMERLGTLFMLRMKILDPLLPPELAEMAFSEMLSLAGLPPIEQLDDVWTARPQARPCPRAVGNRWCIDVANRSTCPSRLQATWNSESRTFHLSHPFQTPFLDGIDDESACRKGTCEPHHSTEP